MQAPSQNTALVNSFHPRSFDRVLVVHSVESLRRELRRIESIPTAGEVEYASSYGEAVTALQRSEKPTVIFCQLRNLEGGTGLALYEFVRNSMGREGANIPFVLMSAHGGVFATVDTLTSAKKDLQVYGIHTVSDAFPRGVVSAIREIGGLQDVPMDVLLEEWAALPLPQSDRHAERVSHLQAPFTHQPKTQIGRVVIVEDEERQVGIIRRNLELFLGSKTEITAHHSGDTAARALINTDNPPDLILMDAVMPRQDGIETTRQLRAAGVTIPILFMTASPHQLREVLVEERGVPFILPKPWSPNNLRQTIVAVQEMRGVQEALDYMKRSNTPGQLAKMHEDILDMVAVSAPRRGMTSVAEPLPYATLTRMLTALLVKDEAFFQDNQFADVHRSICSELFDDPLRAKYVFTYACRARALCDFYRADEIVIPVLISEMMKANGQPQGGLIRPPALEVPNEETKSFIHTTGVIMRGSRSGVPTWDPPTDEEVAIVCLYAAHRIGNLSFDRLIGQSAPAISLQNRIEVSEQRQIDLKAAFERLTI